MDMGFSVNPSKFDCFFGIVTTGDSHNVVRSADNLKNLTKMGITTESQLTNVFKDAFHNGSLVKTATNKYGTTVTKSVNIGENGKIHVGFFYPEGNMKATPTVSTIIPKTW